MSKMSFCNRILSVVLCVCMVLTLLPWVPMAVSAADSNGDGGCENGVHNYNRYTLMCSCGAMSPAVVASVTTGDQTYCYTFLHGAIEYAKYCPPEDHAVLTIQQDIDMGEGYEEIKCGVFTNFGAVYVTDRSNVTITDSVISGVHGIKAYDSTFTIMDSVINGTYIGMEVTNCSVTVSDSTVSGIAIGLCAIGSIVTITGSVVEGCYHGNGLSASYSSTVNISDSTISGIEDGVYVYGSNVTITGGEISGGVYDIHYYTHEDYPDSSMTLSLGENGIGTNFPGGITVSGTTLNAILGEGAAYWQGDQKIIPATDATTISGGDVTIRAACEHSYESVVTEPTCTTDGVKTYTCSKCGYSYTESVPSLGHTEETVAGKDATCTETGLTAGSKCSVCGEVLVAQTEIPSLGHKYENGSCTVCGAAEVTAPSFSVLSKTLNLEGEVKYNMIFMASNTNSAGMKVYYWTAETYNSVDALTVENADGTLDSIVSSGMYMAIYNGLAASQMGDTVYVAAVYENGGNTYTTGVISYSLAKYLTATADGTGEQKNLAAATVIYGYYANIEFPSV